MESVKKYYKCLDIVRIVACIAVFLYHLGYLKGGYLAVCSFFVLSGYLSYVSAFKKDKFSILTYYKERFLHIYLPFAIVTFVSIAIIYFIPSINWLTLKPETSSVLLGYNNFWQLSANLDYFARHANSPFMHFWYMGILLQFEIIFPFIFLTLKKIEEKSKKIVPCVLLGTIMILSIVYFAYMGITETNRMIVYYHTLTRIFSILLGMFIGIIHSYYHTFFIKKISPRIFFWFYFLLFILACIFISAESNYFVIAMILVSILTGRMITYGIELSQDNLSKNDKMIQYFSKISYEIYLFQYPIIFIFQYVTFNPILKVLLILTITILLSIVLHFALEKKKEKGMLWQVLMMILFAIVSGFGLYQYILAEDHTAEMKQLEEQLNQNEKMMTDKQEEYAKRMKMEEEQLNAALKEIENNEAGLEEYIHNLPVIGVGDSVMLGAFSSLYQQFPNGYFDAKVSRTDYEANRILSDIKARGFLGDPIVIGLGTNGQCGASCQYTILQTVENRKVFWINVVNDAEVHVNAGLNRLANDNANVTLIDWVSSSAGHPEYFVADGIHLTSSGRVAYAQTIYDAIYQLYKQEIQFKRDQILKNHEDALSKKISFYGNDILLKAYDSLQKEFKDFETDFHAKQEQTSEDILKEIREASNSNSFSKHVVLLLDTLVDFSEEQYRELDKLPAHVYLVTMKPTSYMDTENITIIDFSKEIHTHSEYLMVDKVHLTDLGNDSLAKRLLDTIQKSSIH